MSIVIVGGHDRMVSQYKKICKEHKCKAKNIIVFTNTVSHKMARCAVTEAERVNADIIRCHTSSQAALNDILDRVV